MIQSLKPTASPAAMPSTPEPETPMAAPVAVTPAETAALEHASALLGALGPVNALRVLGAISEATAKQLDAGEGNPELLHVWRSSSDGIAKLAAQLSDVSTGESDEGEEDEDEASDTDGQDDEESDGEADEDEDEAEVSAEPSASPRKRRTRMRMVAGMFEVKPRVETCRLREVNEMGGRGELVGRANDQGIEQTEWPIATMTPERLRVLTRRRGGKYMFEWFGRDDSGSRAALGRSTAFKVQGDKPKKATAETPAPTPAASSPTGDMFACFLEMQKRSDERTDRERERSEREKQRELELRKHQESLASKERIERMNQQTRLAELRAEANADAAAEAPAPPALRLNEAVIAAHIEKVVAANFARLAPTSHAANESELPNWMQRLGIDANILNLAKPILHDHILPSILAKFTPPGPPGADIKVAQVATPSASPSPYAGAPNVARFVPKGGGSGAAGTG